MATEGDQAQPLQHLRNTYRTLMTRGMKGCYVHCVDPELNAYFKSRLSAVAE